jgi:hypothetical protein
MEQGIRGGIRSATSRHKSRRKPKGCRDERVFWRLERTGAGGVRDARCPWKEPKRALVAAGKMEAAFVVLEITRLHQSKKIFGVHSDNLNPDITSDGCDRAKLRTAASVFFGSLTETTLVGE